MAAIKKLSIIGAAAVLSACAQSGLQTGGSNNLVSGSAGGATNINANKSLERCSSSRSGRPWPGRQARPANPCLKTVTGLEVPIP